MELHLKFVWNDETGETEMTSECKESLHHHFEEHIPIHVLDFLQDSFYMVAEEYNSAFEAYYNRLITTNGEKD